MYALHNFGASAFFCLVFSKPADLRENNAWYKTLLFPLVFVRNASRSDN
jgi:hypothetical protein